MATPKPWFVKRNLPYLFSLFLIAQQLLLLSHAQMRKVNVNLAFPKNDIRKISFYSPNEGFVAYKDHIMYTTDTGWSGAGYRYITNSNVDYNGYPANLTFGFSISGVKAFDQSNIIVYGSYGNVPSILHSGNGGNNFKLIFHSQLGQLPSFGIADMVFPQNNNIGYAVDVNRILKTTDQGLNWSAVYTASNSYFEYLEAVDNNTVFVINTNQLLKTTNAGSAWQSVPLPAGYLKYAFFLTADKGWISMEGTDGRGYFYATTNGGSTWTLKNDPGVTGFVCNKMKFVDDNTGFATGDGFTIYKTVNGGKVWERLLRDNNFEYENYTYADLQVLNSNQLWAAGSSLLELSTNGGGIPVPAAIFKTDTTGYVASGTVNLINYSRTDYTQEWYVNGVLIGTGYHASYTHDVNHLYDTIRLVVSNGATTGESIQYPEFYPPVIVSSFTPATAARGTLITIKGKHFTDGTSVTFGGVPASGFTVVSDTSITAMVSNGASGDVTVSTLRGRGSLPGFTFIPPPVITSFNPTSAKAFTTITITGSEFIGVTAVKMGGVSAVSFTVVSPNEITAVVPSGGSGNVEVTAQGGTDFKTGYIALPDITSFTPTSGTYGTILKITGTSLTGINSITVGGVSPQSFIIKSSTNIDAIVSTGATGDVVVNKPGGSASMPGFKWFPAPTITSFAPVTGPVGTTVVITGTNFDPVPGNNTVYFGGVKATVTTGSATSLTVTVPAGAAHDRISVTSNLLTASSRQFFMVTFANGGAITGNSFTIGGHAGSTTSPMGRDYGMADIDGDGKTDFVAPDFNTPTYENKLTIYRNNSTTGNIQFDSATSYNMRTEIIGIGDLDGDGKPDIVTTYTDKNIWYAVRNLSTPGNISFAEKVEFPGATYRSRVAIGDLDMDGKADVAFTNGTSIAIYRNISDSGYLAFAPKVSVTAAANYNLEIADLDGDGRPELITSANSSGEEITILKNASTKGNIAFTKAATITDLSYSHAFVETGDVDGDGKLDLVATSYAGSTISVHRNTSSPGNISLAGAVTFHSIVQPDIIGLGDLDGDGLLDIAFGHLNNRLAILKNTSSSGVISFAPQVDYLPGPYYSDTGEMIITDINGDGKPDITLTGETSGTADFVINQVQPEPFVTSFTPTIGEEGTTVTITGNNFTAATAVTIGGVPAASYIVHSKTSITAVAGPGATGDVAVTNAYGTGKKAGFSFGLPPVITSISPTSGPVGTSVTITGSRFGVNVADNIVYIGGVRAVVTSASLTSLTITVPAGANTELLTVTTRNLTAHANKPFITTFPGAASTITAAAFAPRFDRAGGGTNTQTSDMDGDGKLDLLFGADIAKNTSSAGALSFADNVKVAQGITGGVFAAGDLDGDGKTDIAIIYDDGHSMSVLRNNSTVGNLLFDSKKVYTTPIKTLGAWEIKIIDVDGDGRPEIVIIGAQCAILFRNVSTPGNIAFEPRKDFIAGGSGTGLCFADIDGDGKADIVASVFDKIAVLRNTSTIGSISFDNKKEFAGVQTPRAVQTADMDGDGKPDVLTTTSNSVAILRNTSTPGNISLAAKQDWFTGILLFDVAQGDLDGDGKPDVIAGNNSSKTISVFKNISTPGTIALSAKLDFDMANYVYNVNISDMDADGQPDIVANVFPGTTILRNLVGAATTVPVCANGDGAITSNITGSSYQWQQNAGNGFQNISDNSNFSGTNTAVLQLKSTPRAYDKYQYRCVVDNNQYSGIFVITITGTPLMPAVTIATPTTNICAGATVTFTATPQNGGAAPSYQWLVSNMPAGGNSNVFTTNTIKNGDEVRVQITNNDACVLSETVGSNIYFMTVNNQVVTPSVSIVPSTDNICAGTAVTFTAAAVNGGDAPVFEWKKNDLATGSNSVNYTDNILAPGDAVHVVLTSNAVCADPATVKSNIVRITVKEAVDPLVSISGNTTVNTGQTTTLTASVVNAGTSPVYQWQDSTAAHRWQNIPGAAAATLVYSPATSGDQVRCVITGNETCSAGRIAVSEALTFTVPNGGRVAPNPVNDVLVIAGLKLSDEWQILEITGINGGNKLITRNIVNQTSVTIPVSQLPAGMYVAILHSSTGATMHLRFTKM